MKKIIFTISIIVLSLNVIAQEAVAQDTICLFLKGINFKNGVDTLEVKANYEELLRGSYEPILKILDGEKKLQYNEYVNQKNGSSSISFTPSNCNTSYVGTLSRKIYDKTFIRKTNDIGAHMKDRLDLKNLKSGQTIYLKFIVFEDKKLKKDLGEYFITVIDVRLL